MATRRRRCVWSNWLPLTVNRLNQFAQYMAHQRRFVRKTTVRPAAIFINFITQSDTTQRPSTTRLHQLRRIWRSLHSSTPLWIHGSITAVQHCSYWCTKNNHGQALCVERGCARCHRQSELWPRPGQILHDELHWLDVPDRVFFRLAVIVHRCLNGRAPQYLSDYCPGRRCWHSATAAFQQPLTSCS